ncbi:MAG: type IX secretion system membrane protein PorP/SprF, partial [Bacteroidia bacterium]|nr:type IX secretion system membrane protein PorP/SprF [Bacteroidia bacterium]
MKKGIGIIVLSLIWMAGYSQNLELRSGKEIKQPGKVNPSLAGVQEDFLRLLTDAEVGKSYQFMVEGKLPLRLGNYMVGYERLFTDEVANNMINITYARTNKKDKLLARKKEDKKKFEWRYGATIQIHQKSFLKAGAFDSSAGGFQFQDINGEIQTVPKLDDINTSLDYFNVVLGGSMKYNNLMVGLSVENLLQQDVSLSKLESRKIPFTGNFIVGGFLPLGEKATLFPSAVAVFSSDDIFAKASIDLS